MLAHVKAFLQDRQGRARAPDGRHNDEELRLAGRFDPKERARVAAVLQTRFALDAAEVSSLIDAAAGVVDESVEIYGFTRLVKQNFDHDERVKLIEMLWEVAYADGELHPFEANLLRRVSGLLYVTDQESGAARKRVISRLGAADHPDNR
jgi:uncharacterized tellurite resistance protein B-like protein